MKAGHGAAEDNRQLTADNREATTQNGLRVAVA